MDFSFRHLQMIDFLNEFWKKKFMIYRMFQMTPIPVVVYSIKFILKLECSVPN